MIVADSDVLIDFLADKGAARTVEKYLRKGTLRTTVVNRFELLSGAKTPGQFAKTMQLLAAVPSLDLDDLAADAASEIRKTLEKDGNGIGMADSLIAGIVFTNDAILLTRNKRHFERVEGLRLV